MRISPSDLLKRKMSGQKIAVITAYDYPFAKIAEEAGIDVLLVGDSLAMVVQGLDNTLPVTMDEMIYHTKMVTRGAKNAMVIADMPYMSYQISNEECVRNAGRFLKEGFANAVKIEGGREVVEKVKLMTLSEIPVVAHIGLTPQSIYKLGGYKVQGKTEEAKKRLLEDANMLEQAGAFMIVLEAIPSDLAKSITESLSIPTIGIGAGIHCDGQVLVLHDVLGLFDRFMPKFVKRYGDLKNAALNSLKTYKEEVEKNIFPSDSHSF
ncbi:MAG: 3-methyl-2-oxobutanoate hydroxymethyltransferase [Thermodesulfovibrionales bacterium]|nr:3-methyl-2-oxobutanoate hydroxymethyltransferase [Thermodesulfovibrionales bacterium]